MYIFWSIFCLKIPSATLRLPKAPVPIFDVEEYVPSELYSKKRVQHHRLDGKTRETTYDGKTYQSMIIAERFYKGRRDLAGVSRRYTRIPRPFPMNSINSIRQNVRNQSIESDSAETEVIR